MAFMSENTAREYEKQVVRHAGENLYDHYKTPSQAKQKAFDSCMDYVYEIRKRENVIDVFWGITGANASTFTFGIVAHKIYGTEVYKITAYNMYHGFYA